jgi:hypothetical protein
MKATLALDKDIAGIAAGSAERAAFESSFKTDVAAANYSVITDHN